MGDVDHREPLDGYAYIWVGRSSRPTRYVTTRHATYTCRGLTYQLACDYIHSRTLGSRHEATFSSIRIVMFDPQMSTVIADE